MPDINIGDAVPFEQLQSADLVLGCVYRGGAAGSVADDPLNRLIPVGNAGGFRYKGSSEAPLLIALYTTGAEDDWPDSLDPLTSTFTYYGDNRKPGRPLLDTPRHGNEILRRTFERAHGDPRARAQVAPHLLFAKAGQGRDVVFRGLLAPGAQTLTASEDLVVIAHDRQGLELRNYRATFTVLDARHVTRAWLNDVLAGEPLSGNCPDAWREWVTDLAYQPLARFPQDAEDHAVRAEFDAQSRNDPPISDEDARRRLQREIFARQGQSDFRESLIRAYRGQCAVTGCAVLPVLEAAHLRPYRGAHTNLVTNGLLLRADIHTLLDYKLWAPEPGTRAIAISRLLVDTRTTRSPAGRSSNPPPLHNGPQTQSSRKSGWSSARPRRRGSSKHHLATTRRPRCMIAAGHPADNRSGVSDVADVRRPTLTSGSPPLDAAFFSRSRPEPHVGDMSPT